VFEMKAPSSHLEIQAIAIGQIDGFAVLRGFGEGADLVMDL
jgi:hypothetical protein